jgi:hypothetical protein
MSGTGGNFISALLSAARSQNKSILRFSKHGNSHLSMNDVPMIGGTEIPDFYQIKYLLGLSKSVASDKVFAPIHLIELSEVLKVFHRAIRITYQQDDIDEISKIWIVKWGIDSQFMSYKDATTYYKFSVRQLTNNLNSFQEDASLSERVHYLSWKDIYKDDVNALITKLSSFSGYKHENFYTDKIIDWRDRTNKCIVLANNLLGEK